MQPARLADPDARSPKDVARAEALGDDLDGVSGISLDKGTELDALAATSTDTQALSCSSQECYSGVADKLSPAVRRVPELTRRSSIKINKRVLLLDAGHPVR
jgi:hypothetical protein